MLRFISLLLFIFLLPKTFGFYLQNSAFSDPDEASAVIFLQEKIHPLDSQKTSYLRIYVKNRGDNEESVIDFSDEQGRPTYLRGIAERLEGSKYSPVTTGWLCFLGLYYPNCLEKETERGYTQIPGVNKLDVPDNNFHVLALLNQNPVCFKSDDHRLILIMWDVEITCRILTDGSVSLKTNIKIAYACIAYMFPDSPKKTLLYGYDVMETHFDEILPTARFPIENAITCHFGPDILMDTPNGVPIATSIDTDTVNADLHKYARNAIITFSRTRIRVTNLNRPNDRIEGRVIFVK